MKNTHWTWYNQICYQSHKTDKI